MHHAEYLNERKKMMQWWADYLDSRLASNVVQLNRGGAKSLLKIRYRSKRLDRTQPDPTGVAPPFQFDGT